MKILLQKIAFGTLIGFFAYQGLVAAQTAMGGGVNHCGDGALEVQLGEECDDGNYISGDGCSSNCEDETKPTKAPTQTPVSIVDPHPTTTYKVFKKGKTVPAYITSTLSARELCDTGPDNGIVCEPGYGGKCTYCSEVCEPVTVTGPVCGDGIVQHKFEQCDDGNRTNGDGCNSNCKKENTVVVQVPTPSPTTQQPHPLIVIPAEGVRKPVDTTKPDIVKEVYTKPLAQPSPATSPSTVFQQPKKVVTVLDVDESEKKKEKSVQDKDTITITAIKITKEVQPLTLTPVYAKCGDGIKQMTEQCDDNNLTSGDGCSAGCMIEQAAVLPTTAAPAKIQARSQSVIRTTPAGEGIGITNPYPAELGETGARLPIVHLQTIYLFLSIMIGGIGILLFRGSEYNIQ